MTTGNNTTTVTINKQANDILDQLAAKHQQSKVALVSCLVMAMATLDYEQVSSLVSSGQIVAILLKLGGKVDYPNGIVTKDVYVPLPIIRLFPSDKEQE